MSKENESDNCIDDWCEEVKNAKWENIELKEYILERDKKYIDDLIKVDEDKKKKWGIKAAWEKHNLYQLPHLFSGDLENAKIIVLIANPGNRDDEIKDCANHFKEREKLLIDSKSPILSEKMGENTHGWSWTRRTYLNAFWTDDELKDRIKNEEFDKLFVLCKNSEEFRQRLKDCFSLDEDTSKKFIKFIKKMGKDKTPYELSSIYEMIEKERGTKGLLRGFVQQMHIGLINRYVASAEYYPYHSETPYNFSFIEKKADSEEDKYLMPSTEWIINQVLKRIKNCQNSREEPSFTFKQEPLIIIPRESGQKLWVKQEKAFYEKGNRYCVPVDGLDTYERILACSTSVPHDRNGSLLKPENLRMYQNKKVNEGTNERAKGLLGEVLDEMIKELKSQE